MIFKNKIYTFLVYSLYILMIVLLNFLG